MGGGSWSANVYSSRATTKATAGIPTFAYHSTVAASGDWKVHDTLDPKLTNKKGLHADQNIRESLDSAEHPNSVAIAVLFDETGSMGMVPELLQKKLPELFGMILRKGYVEDPQILFGALGDATSDHVPLQVGQFESDNRSDENLENFVLEGNGGGQKRESYELAMYFMARHTYIDCFEKRGKKGYLFIVGDEMPYRKVNFKQVEKLIGDKINEDISTEDILNELKEKWEIFYFLANTGSGYINDPEVIGEWRKYLGQNAIKLEDPATVCEALALAIGVNEGIDINDATQDLVAIGVSSKVAKSVSSAVAPIASGKGSVAKAEGDLAIESTDSGSKRL